MQTTYVERMSKVLPNVVERVYSLIRESISARRPIEDLLEDVREHALQSSRYWRCARNCYGERRLDLLRGELETVASAVIAEAVAVTYQEQKRIVSSTGEHAVGKKSPPRKKGVAMGKVLALSVRQAAGALGVGKSTIYRRIAAETLACKVVNNQQMIPLSALKKQIGAEEYAKIKTLLEAGEDPFPTAKKPAAKPAKRPCKKAVGKKGGKK